MTQTKEIKQDDMVLEVILSNDFHKTDIETIEVLVSEIKKKIQISQIVDYLTKTIPLKDLNHLKRIKAQDSCYEVIICVNNSHNEKLIEDMKQYLTENDLLPLKKRSVAFRPPLTRSQYELSAKLWPTNFHENKYIAKCLNSTLFDSNTRNRIFDIISKAIQMSDNCSDKCSVVAIVTDSSNNIITIAKSDVGSHPLKHAVMVAVDQVSRLQGGGYWNKSVELQEYETKLKDDSYLCTGFGFYVTQEPCMMCAMALVHSRIRRLFFLDCSQTEMSHEYCDRAITKHKLHILPKLNHHYESWKISFKL